MIRIIVSVKLKNVGVIVLAGGNSSRMSFPKSWLTYFNNQTFLETIIYKYRSFGFKEITISLNKADFLTKYDSKIEELKRISTFVKNNSPEKGRLYSLHTALNQLQAVDFAIIHNVDNPFVENDVINTLLNEKNYSGSTIPSYLGQSGHPIIINKMIIEEIVNNYEKYETLKELVGSFERKYVDVNSSSILKNINTPEEYNNLMNELV